MAVRRWMVDGIEIQIITEQERTIFLFFADDVRVVRDGRTMTELNGNQLGALVDLMESVDNSRERRGFSS